MANNRPMTEDEKKLLQAQHRMEAIEARNRQKERKARTRRGYYKKLFVVFIIAS